MLFMLRKIFSDLLSMGGSSTNLRKYSIGICFLNDFTEENSNGKKSHLKVPIELCAIQTLTNLWYC